MAPISVVSIASRAHARRSGADLLGIERLRETPTRGRLDPAQPHQRQEGVLAEPGLAALRRKALADGARLLVRGGGVERNEEVRRAEVRVVLRDLVLEDEMVAEGVPGQLPDRAVVLVQIALVVREDQIGAHFA